MLDDLVNVARRYVPYNRIHYPPDECLGVLILTTGPGETGILNPACMP